MARLPAFLLALALAACQPSPRAPLHAPDANVVLIVIDALRPDHLPVYGYPKSTAPFLSEKAARGVVFEEAYAASTWTPSSMASLFTSLYPNQHQVWTGFRARRCGAANRCA